MKEPDDNQLRAVSAEIERLGDAGELTQEAYARLWKQAVEAAGDNAERLDGIRNYARWYGLKA